MYWAFAVAMETIVPCYLSLEHKHAPASNVIPFQMRKRWSSRLCIYTHTHIILCTKNCVLFLWDSSSCSIPVCKRAGEREEAFRGGETPKPSEIEGRSVDYKMESACLRIIAFSRETSVISLSHPSKPLVCRCLERTVEESSEKYRDKILILYDWASWGIHVICCWFKIENLNFSLTFIAQILGDRLINSQICQPTLFWWPLTHSADYK